MPVKGWALSSGKNMSALAQQLIVNMLEDLDGTAFERLQILLHQKAQPWAKSKSKSTISVGLKKHECNQKMQHSSAGVSGYRRSAFGVS